ncbi:(S)-beta-bisabolene synthase [Platanthera guangdongensis]|uniref:(S)-beta-bisabolene synthase n=1 Tax=Platanthera guangdongensis TaxID=2320717 RepID=A0ABR2MV15_9ASPA
MLANPWRLVAGEPAAADRRYVKGAILHCPLDSEFSVMLLIGGPQLPAWTSGSCGQNRLAGENKSLQTEPMVVFGAVYLLWWEVESINRLPEYMHYYTHALFKTVKDAENELAQEQNLFCLDYLKQEAAGFPEIIKAFCLIGRIMNDIVSYKLEQKRIHIASTVQCYLVEHECSEEEACLKHLEMSNKAWKTINKEFLTLNKLPLSLIRPIMNLAWSNEYVYLRKDMYTQSEEIVKENINVVLIEPVQINGLRD